VGVENKVGGGGQLAAQALKAAAADGHTVFIAHDHTLSILPLVSRAPGFDPAKDFVPAPYRGSAPMIGDMLGNPIAAGVGSMPDFIENHRTGRLRVLAVLGRARQEALPEVPSFGEMGLTGFDDLPYCGFWAPAGTPAAAVDVMSPAQLATREAGYPRNWAEIIKRSGFQRQ
jgi:tripartite-type tricarboxylate transporter receptor subunit TctC